MPWAGHVLSVGIDAARAGGVRATSPMCPKSVATQPVSDRRLAESKPIGDRACGQAGVDQRGQSVLVDPAPRRVAIPVDGGETMPLNPVSDSGWMAAGELADSLERQPITEILL